MKKCNVRVLSGIVALSLVFSGFGTFSRQVHAEENMQSADELSDDSLKSSDTTESEAPSEETKGESEESCIKLHTQNLKLHQV